MFNSKPTPQRYAFAYQKLKDGWFHSVPFQSLAFNLPSKLLIEPVIRNDYQSRGAEELIHGQMVNGKWEFFSGLLSTCERGFKRGDHLRQSKGHTVKSLFIVSQLDNDHLSLIYYPNYWVSNVSELSDFVCSEVEQFSQSIYNS
jgi:hypothetical protein